MLALALSALPAATCQPVQARPDAAAVIELVSATDCGETPTVEESEAGFSLRFPSLTVEADEGASAARKVCTVELVVDPPEQFSVVRGGFEASGAATVPQGARGPLVSIRYFAPGEPGSDAFASLDAGAGAREFTAASRGDTQSLPCGEKTHLTLLVDISARPAADDPTRTIAVALREIKVPILLRACAEP